MLLPFMLLALGVDTLAVSLSLGLKGLERRDCLRIGAVFALFEALMPAAGLLIGRSLSGVLGEAAGYLAAGLLLLFGAREIWEAAGDNDDKDDDQDGEEDEDAGRSGVHGVPLILSAFSVSIDELCLGFSLGVIHAHLTAALIYIGVQAFVLTFLGLSLGQRIGKQIGEKAEMAGGIVLVLLAIALFVEMLTRSRL